MNKENLLKWIEELETTGKKQGRGYLHKFEQDGTESFCCLGILNEVAMKNGVQLKVEESTQYPYISPRSFIRYNGDSAFPTKEVLEWLDIPEKCVSAKKSPASTIPTRVDNLNDDDLLTFKEIAACLRDTYLRE